MTASLTPPPCPRYFANQLFLQTVGPVCSRLSGFPPLGGLRLVLPGKLHPEERSLAWGALHRHRASQARDDLMDDPEPQPEAAVVLMRHGALEALEDAVAVLLPDADALIHHLQGGVGGLLAHAELHGGSGAVLE